MQKTNEKIKNKLEYFRLHLTNHYKALNRGATLLFIATLACWAVDNPSMRILGAFTVLFIYISVVIENRKDDRVFESVVKEIERRIEDSNLDKDLKKERSYDLSDIWNDNNYKKLFIAPRYLICYLFWFVTVYFFIG